MAQASQAAAVAAPPKPNAAVTPSGSAAVHPRGIPPFQISPVKRGDRYLKFMIYGKHGNGKTTLAASSADVDEMADVLMIDCESGDLTIQDNARVIHTDRIMSVKVTDWKTIGRIFEYLSAHCVHRDAKTPEAVEKLKDFQSWLTGTPVEQIDRVYRFRTVILDSLSEAEQYNMTGLMGYTEEELMGEKTESDDVEVAGWGEFRKNKLMIEFLVRKFRSLPMNFICVCAESFVEDEIKRKTYMPALTGKLARTIQGPFDVVGHLSMGEKDASGNQQRLLRVKPDNRIDAKCRFSSFQLEGFQDPTMSKIMTAVGLLGARGS